MEKKQGTRISNAALIQYLAENGVEFILHSRGDYTIDRETVVKIAEDLEREGSSSILLYHHVSSLLDYFLHGAYWEYNDRPGLNTEDEFTVLFSEMVDGNLSYIEALRYCIDNKRKLFLGKDEIGILSNLITTYREEAIEERKARAARHKIKTNCTRFKKRCIKKDLYWCQICGSRENLEVDHIIEVQDSGTSEVSNLQILCKSCHLAKTKNERKIRKECRPELTVAKTG